MEEKRDKFLKRLHEIDERFSTMLAWEDNYKNSNKSKILMTPATEFYRLYKREIDKMQEENERLRGLLENINQLSKLNK